LKIKAAVLRESLKELAVEEIEFRDSLKVGQVLVKIQYSGICGAQINEIDAVKGPDKFLPHLLGHEGVGIVIDVGPGVKKVSVGDRVILHWRKGSGIEATPARFFSGETIINSGWVTTFSDHSVVSENRITVLPKAGLDEMQKSLPLLGCALTTALGVLENDAKVGIRDHVLIFGAGGVGLCLVGLSRIFGIRNLSVVDIDSAKLGLAKQLGAINTILYQDKETCAKELGQLSVNNGFSVAIETSGKKTSIELSYELSSSSARVVLVGVPNAREKVSLYTLPLHFGKRIYGSHGGQSDPDRDIPFLLDLMGSGKFDVEKIPLNIYSLNNVNNAINGIRSGNVGRTILDMENI
jgi:Zn-dependent alcohol dehydrogenase